MHRRFTQPAFGVGVLRYHCLGLALDRACSVRDSRDVLCGGRRLYTFSTMRFLLDFFECFETLSHTDIIWFSIYASA